MELVTHKWFASSLLLPQSCRGNRRKPHFFSFFTLTAHSVKTHLKLFLLSFVFSLSGTVGRKREIGLWRYRSTFSPASLLQSTLQRTVIHFSFPNVPRLYVSFSSVLSLYCISLSPSPMRWLRVAVDLQAVCGMVLWAGIWQPLIRERVSWCYSFWDVFYIFFFQSSRETIGNVFFFFLLCLKDLVEKVLYNRLRPGS